MKEQTKSIDNLTGFGTHRSVR